MISSVVEDMIEINKDFETWFQSLWDSLPASKQQRIKEIVAFCDERG